MLRSEAQELQGAASALQQMAAQKPAPPRAPKAQSPIEILRHDLEAFRDKAASLPPQEAAAQAKAGGNASLWRLRSMRSQGFSGNFAGEEPDAFAGAPLPGQVISGQKIVALLSQPLDMQIQRGEQ